MIIKGAENKGDIDCALETGSSVDAPNSARDAYKKFLTTGESDHPIELLKIAGVDMGTEAPVKNAMQVFAELVDEFDRITRE